MSFDREIIVALAVLLAVMVWVFRKTGDPTGPHLGSFGEILEPRPPTRRAELFAARSQVRRQVEVMETPGRRSRNAEFSRASLSDLKAILREIETELRELDDGS